MAKATSRKHATHKKARAHHAAKPHARRPSTFKPSTPGITSPMEAQLKSELVGEEPASRSDSRVGEENLDDEAGIYGPKRGETAG